MPQLNTAFKQKSNTACNNGLFSGGTITPMHPTTERLYQAARDLKRTVGQSAVAALIGESPQTVKNWESRGVSSQGAINAGAIIGFNVQWLKSGVGQMADASGASRSAPLNESDFTPYTVNPYSDTKMILAPVVEWASLESDLYKDNKEVIASRFEAISAGAKPNTKWVEVEADMPRLMLSRGDLVLITPVSGQHECKESKVHLFKTVGNAYFLGTFRSMASGFEAFPDSGPSLESEKHGVKVVGIKHGHIERI